MRDELLDTLHNQHNQLRGELGIMAEIIKKKNGFDAKLILSQLKKFKKDLHAHWKLENNIFYVQLIEKMEKKKMNTERTINFIGQMKELTREINAFLLHFNTEDKVNDDKNKFKKKFSHMSNRLLMRSELEEDSVFMYWEFLLG